MRPAFVQSGDTIALICTARWLTKDQGDEAVRLFAEHELVLLPAPHVTTQHYQLAGSTEQRARDLQWALDHPEIKGIIVGRGGYGTVQLLDLLDWSGFKKYPKWVVGFSDVTALLAHINAQGISAIHGPMPVQLPNVTDASKSALFQALKGKHRGMQWQGAVQGHWPWNEACRVYGGNLSVICSLLDSPSWQPEGPYYLVIEDLDEMLYHLDRMLYAFARSKSAQGLRGVLVGGMTDFKDNTVAFGFSTDNPWGHSAMEIISQWALRFEFPLLTQLPVGHQAENYPLYLGETASIRRLDANTFDLTWTE
jgi:muramoyltetrapeptide carboxypeptidase